MRIGRYGVGVCQIADCDKDSTLRIFTKSYRSALAPKGFQFHFDLCTDHYIMWDSPVMGQILEAKPVSRETGKT